jgi:hypothetical protein
VASNNTSDEFLFNMKRTIKHIIWAIEAKNEQKNSISIQVVAAQDQSILLYFHGTKYAHYSCSIALEPQNDFHFEQEELIIQLKEQSWKRTMLQKFEIKQYVMLENFSHILLHFG